MDFDSYEQEKCTAMLKNNQQKKNATMYQLSSIVREKAGALCW